MTTWPDELRLAYALLLTALVFASAVRFARRAVGGDWVETLLDALLITFVIQYASVALPGVVGALNVWSIAVTAVLACGVLNAAAREKPKERAPVPTPPPDDEGASTAARPTSWPAVGLALFVVCYVVAIIWQQRLLPPMANDALTYHLPAAVEWVQSGRLDLYETWYYNPANTYSPMAGSVLMTWWLAPLGNDVLARFVQAPALLLLFCAMVQIVRAFGVSTTVAALVATGAVTARPFISQVLLAKDDLFVASFFATAVAGMTRVKLTDGLGAWRAGLALGMLLATKYTALLSVPLLLLAIDAPVRAGWRVRHWLVAFVCALALAAPWYVRNAMLTANPFFPLELPGLPGMFETLRSNQLTSIEDLLKVFVTGYYSATIPVAVALALCWLAAIMLSSRNIVRNPLVRICLIGPPLGIGLFLIASPYAEVRFILPSLLLMFACGGLVAFRSKSPPLMLVIGIVIALAGIATGFRPHLLREVLPPAIGASVLLLLIAGSIAVLDAAHARRAIALGSLGAAALLGCVIYVYYGAYIRREESGYRDLIVPAWSRAEGYGKLADAWEHVRQRVPAGSTIAYANTYYTYPLYRFDFQTRVVYAPTRADIIHVHNLPHFVEPMTGEQLTDAVAAALAANPDRQAWLTNLAGAEAEYLFVVKPPFGPQKDPPELRFAQSDSQRFHIDFENDAAVVYRIEQPAP